ncbi:6-carboxytetrahydropterin synthase [Coraliomargarita sp. SDUM461003]|uniref:6-carboxy-5,6,7,8-tetrahydropterin synthase n=1 Tax=Thalassobacterium maritimum TaxID=3041265 RepID=A0ABU1ASS7_9BACT|nr:6-carboxytetrahydropterin synthase [Coraliomargarita sp. SDUM461003]MDQ8206672.1 6-carboxytetrahydropterin synthase [Coraliomargarita sp. SDUM461003]
MITCSKIYTDIPFAHRQHLHSGHCSQIHGHNWDIKLDFACSEYDSNGFVVDFGKLKYLKKYIDDNLDHACVFSDEDPLAKQILDSAPAGVYQPYWVKSASGEGLAKHLYQVFSALVREHEGERVWISGIEIFEDRKNTVKFIPQL